MMENLAPAIIVGLVLAATKFLDWYGSTALSRPLFCVAILGALLGHPVEGIVLGAQLELVFLGNVSLGGVMPSDFTLGSIFGGAFAMLLGQDLAAAVTLALPLSALGTLLYSAMKMVITSLVPKFEGLIKNHDLKGFKALWIGQFVCFHLAYFILGFLCIFLGTDAVGAFVAVIPAWIQKAMTVAAGMLPALGMALLLKSLWTRDTCPYYFLGFALGAFFFYTKTTGASLVDGAITLASSTVKTLSLVQISVVGAIIAALVIFAELRKIKESEKMKPVGAAASNEREDFFND